LKDDLRRRNGEAFGYVGRKKNIILEELRVLEIIEEERALGYERLKEGKGVKWDRELHSHEVS